MEYKPDLNSLVNKGLQKPLGDGVQASMKYAHEPQSRMNYPVRDIPEETIKQHETPVHQRPKRIYSL